MKALVPIADDSPFPLENLPWGAFTRPGESRIRLGVALGDWVVDLAWLAQHGLLPTQQLPGDYFLHQESLNDFLGRGPDVWREVRMLLTHLLSDAGPDAVRASLVPRGEVTMRLPMRIGDYTDFYSSREHATNVGTLMRGPENALSSNWLHLPIAYHGRSSSIVLSGTDVRRPWGQIAADVFAPSRRLDYELELGCVIGPGNVLGTPIAAADASQHIFGFVLVNDWSARDHQKWEYQPLGPFLSKNFATSISPWIVPLEALQPFRVAGPVQAPEPLPYLRTKEPWNFDLHLEVSLQTATSRQRLSLGNAKYLYWNICQQIAHHTVGGCNLQPGDLLASGTISGPEREMLGCLLERTRGGAEPIALADGTTRTFLEDGDVVTMTGWCTGSGVRIGFGEVTGRVLAACREPGRPVD